jgi:hypothetical protein
MAEDAKLNQARPPADRMDNLFHDIDEPPRDRQSTPTTRPGLGSVLVCALLAVYLTANATEVN